MTLEERNAIYDKAKALVLQGWCQFAYAKNDEGVVVPYEGEWPEHRNFCGVAAVLNCVSHFTFNSKIFDPLNKIVRAFNHHAFGDYNDAPGRTKYEVAAVFDHAKEQPL